MVTAQDLVQDKRVQKLMETIDADTDKALKTCKSNLGSSGAKGLPADVLKNYRADSERLKKAQANFSGEWTMVAVKKSKNVRKLLVAYEKYILALIMLGEKNNAFTAVVDSKLAEAAAGIVAIFIVLQKAAAARFQQLQKELEDLKKNLEKAQKEVKEAKLQQKLNLIVTAITFCLGPVSLTARLLVAGGSIAAHTIIDAALGPSRGSVTGSATTVASDLAGASKKLPNAAKKLAGAAGAAVTLKLDDDEIQQAKKNVADAKKRLVKAVKELESLAKIVEGHAGKLAKLHKGLETAFKAVQAKTSSYKASTQTYEALKKEFKKVK